MSHCRPGIAAVDFKIVDQRTEVKPKNAKHFAERQRTPEILIGREHRTP